MSDSVASAQAWMSLEPVIHRIDHFLLYQLSLKEYWNLQCILVQDVPDYNHVIFEIILLYSLWMVYITFLEKYTVK